MPTEGKSRRRTAPKGIRQSVTIPGPLAHEVRRVAKERRLTISRALVSLAEQGVEAELDARKRLRTAYTRFLEEKDPTQKDEAGKDLIRAIFGSDALAEDPIR